MTVTPGRGSAWNLCGDRPVSTISTCFHHNPQTDVYSFGIVIAEVFARKDPYSDLGIDDPSVIVSRITDTSINLRPTLPTGCSHDVAVLMRECVASDPLKRPTFEEIGKSTFEPAVKAKHLLFTDQRIGRLDTESLNVREAKFSYQQKKAARNEELLNRVFPKHVAEALRDGRQVSIELTDNGYKLNHARSNPTGQNLRQFSSPISWASRLCLPLYRQS